MYLFHGRSTLLHRLHGFEVHMRILQRHDLCFKRHSRAAYFIDLLFVYLFPAQGHRRHYNSFEHSFDAAVGKDRPTSFARGALGESGFGGLDFSVHLALQVLFSLLQHVQGLSDFDHRVFRGAPRHILLGFGEEMHGGGYVQLSRLHLKKFVFFPLSPQVLVTVTHMSLFPVIPDFEIEILSRQAASSCDLPDVQPTPLPTDPAIQSAFHLHLLPPPYQLNHVLLRIQLAPSYIGKERQGILDTLEPYRYK